MGSTKRQCRGDSGLGAVLVSVACVLLVAVGPASGAERFRTPAEIEIRRTQVAARLSELAAEAAALEAVLTTLGRVPVEAPNPAEGEAVARERQRATARLEVLGAERATLGAEAAELAAIRTRTATGPITRADPAGLVPAQVAGPTQDNTGQVAAGNAFNPAITVIPDGMYYNDNQGGAVDRIVNGADGFDGPGTESEQESLDRGFVLNEVELTFSGAVDPYFDFWGTFTVADGGIEIEEAYVQTRRFLPGVQVRFGHFLSGIGYLNRQHRHQWDFVDQALPYAAIFGDHIAETGLQVTWLPALPVYTQVGFEALQGENRLFANRLFEQYPENLADTPGPRLFTGFVKVSPDLGFAHTVQGGVSFGRSRRHQETAGPAQGARDGTAWFLGSDWVWRLDSSRPFGERDLTVQGEYLYRVKAFDPMAPVLLDPRASRQDGAYVQAVYGIGPRWTVAGRMDVIGMRNDLEAGSLSSDLSPSSRYSANVTFNPTEFSRLRVQYNHGNVSQNGTVHFDQVFAQFQMSLGVHGVHRF